MAYSKGHSKEGTAPQGFIICCPKPTNSGCCDGTSIQIPNGAGSGTSGNVGKPEKTTSSDATGDQPNENGQSAASSGPGCVTCGEIGKPDYGEAGGGELNKGADKSEKESTLPSGSSASFTAGGDGKTLKINPATGICCFQINTPNAGPLAPQPSFNLLTATPSSIQTSTSYNLATAMLGRYFQRLSGPLESDTLIEVISECCIGKNGACIVEGYPDDKTYIIPPGLGNPIKVHETGPYLYEEIHPNGFSTFFGTTGLGGTYVPKVIAGPDNVRYTCTYSTHNLSSIKDPKDRDTSFSYDENDKLRTITDHSGRVTTMTIDKVSGQEIYLLKDVTTPEGCVTQLVYDDNHRLEGWIKPDTGRITLAYASSGARAAAGDDVVQNVEWPDGNMVTYTYDTGKTTYTDASGALTTILYEREDQITGFIQPSGMRHTYTWDDDRHTLISKEDPLGNVTTFNYIEFKTVDGDFVSVDERRLESIVYPSGRRFTHTFDGDARVQQITNENDFVTTLVWDGDTFIRDVVVDTLGNRTSYTYEDGQIITIEDPLSRISSKVYDSSTGQIINDINPEGEITTYTYNTHGQQTEVIDPLGNVNTTLYDLMGRAVKKIDPLGNHTTMTYGMGGQLETVEDPLGHETNYYYDLTGRLEAMENAAGERTTYGYDPRGLRITVENPLGLVTTSHYDVDLQMIATENPLGERTTTHYDAAGRVVATEDARGHRTTSHYDIDDRLEAIENAEGERTTFGYDGVGNRITVEDATGFVSTMHYDALNRVQASENPLGKRATTVYDAAAQVIEQINPLDLVTTNHYDDAGRMIAIENPMGERTTTHYDLAGRGASIEDPLGHRTTSHYDEASRPIAAENALGQLTTTGYDIASRSITVTDPLGHVTTSHYDAASRLIAAENALGKRSTSVYENGRMIATIDPLGLRTTSHYDDAGRVIATENAEGERSTSVYEDGQLVASIDLLGQRTTQHYDDAGRNIAVQNAENERTTAVYEDGQQVASINPLGNRTTSHYDDAGRVIATENAEDDRTTTTYDAAGQSIATENARNYITTVHYDDAGRLKSIQNALDQRTTSHYDAAGRSIAIENGLSFRTTQHFDDANRPIAVQNAENERTTTHYDAAGRTLSIENGEGERTTSHYDDANRVIAVQNGLDYRTTSGYDDAGRVVTLTDARNNVTTTSYDDANRPIAVTDAKGYVTTSHYESGRLHSLEDGRGNRTTYGYDKANRKTTETDPLGRVTTYTYDATGQMETRLNARGITTTFHYDTVGRLDGRTFTNDAAHTFTYDAVGNRETMVDGTGATTWTYDELNRVKTAQVTIDLGGTPTLQITTHTYDAASRRRTMTEPTTGGVFTYTYDDANRITTLEDLNDKRTTYVYDDAGRTTRKEVHGGVYAETQYDATGQIKALRNFFPSDDRLALFTYTYDEVGNREVVEEELVYSGIESSRSTYTYDATNQLLTEHRTGDITPIASTYTYDGVGNQEVKHLTRDGSTTRTTCVYDAANQLDWCLEGADDRTTYTYDKAGNQELALAPSDARTTNVWNDENRRVVHQASYEDYEHTATYNGDGQRITKVAPDGTGAERTRQFIWDGSDLLAEWWSGVTTSPRYIYTLKPEGEFGRLVSGYAPGLQNGISIDYVYDALGSTSHFTTVGPSPGQTTILPPIRYDAFGAPITSLIGGSGVPLGLPDQYYLAEWGYYTDKYYTGSGQGILAHLVDYYVRARTYDPSIARWLSQDPLGFAAGDVNLYRYVENNPVLLIDPSGMFVDDENEIGGLADVFAGKGKRYFYTCNCGWVDTEHVAAYRNNYQKIYKAIDQGDASVTVGLRAPGTLVGDWDLKIKLNKKKLSTEYYAYIITFKFAFLEEQVTWNASIYNASGFASEDITSDMIGAIVGKHMLDNNLEKKQGMTDATKAILKECHIVTKKQAIAVYKANDSNLHNALSTNMDQPAMKKCPCKNMNVKPYKKFDQIKQWVGTEYHKILYESAEKLDVDLPPSGVSGLQD